MGNSRKGLRRAALDCVGPYKLREEVWILFLVQREGTGVF